VNEALCKTIVEQLEVILGRTGKAGGSAIQDALRHLDQIALERKDELDPHLLHFLQKRSYQKAMDFLKEKGF
jgi:hypothetical protein